MNMFEYVRNISVVFYFIGFSISVIKDFNLCYDIYVIQDQSWIMMDFFSIMEMLGYKNVSLEVYNWMEVCVQF